MMKNPVLYNSLVVGVIVLFIGVGMQPSVAVQPETEIDIEPKDYLFQTIIDIANNPEVQNLLEKYKPDLFKGDIDRSDYRKLFFRNPRLIFNTFFSKPSISVEYLDKCYNNGIAIAKIIGEDKVLEIIENVEVTDTKFFDNLNNIISNDEKLSGRFETLKEMNKDIKLDWDFPIICFTLQLLIYPVAFVWSFLFDLLIKYEYNRLIYFVLIILNFPFDYMLMFLLVPYMFLCEEPVL